VGSGSFLYTYNKEEDFDVLDYLNCIQTCFSSFQMQLLNQVCCLELQIEVGG